MGFDILTLVTFFPLLGALLLLFVPKSQEGSVKAIAVIIAFITLLLSIFMYVMFDPYANGMQFETNIPWVPSFGIQYHLGIDGISLLLIMLTTILSLIAIISSWSAITTGIKGYYISLLLLETGMLGVFVALDLFLFYVFWEAMLVPMYFLIGVWGGPRKIYAAIKFVLFTMFGSLLMLVALLYLFFMYHAYSGEYSFDLLKLYQMPIPLGAQTYMFLAFALAFAIKVPIWPFHTWLPDAHVEAPTAGSVILAGVLLKMGTYGFVRICSAVISASHHAIRPAYLYSCHNRYHIRGAGFDGAARRKIPYCLFICFASWICHAWHDGPQPAGTRGLRHSDD